MANSALLSRVFFLILSCSFNMLSSAAQTDTSPTTTIALSLIHTVTLTVEPSQTSLVLHPLPTSPQSLPNLLITDTGYSLLGCYHLPTSPSNHKDIAIVKSFHDEDFSVLTCLEGCALYFSAQDTLDQTNQPQEDVDRFVMIERFRCTCRHVLPTQIEHTEDSFCNAPCAGDPRQACGGFINYPSDKARDIARENDSFAVIYTAVGNIPKRESAANFSPWPSSASPASASSSSSSSSATIVVVATVLSAIFALVFFFAMCTLHKKRFVSLAAKLSFPVGSLTNGGFNHRRRRQNQPHMRLASLQELDIRPLPPHPVHSRRPIDWARFDTIIPAGPFSPTTKASFRAAMASPHGGRPDKDAHSLCSPSSFSTSSLSSTFSSQSSSVDKAHTVLGLNTELSPSPTTKPATFQQRSLLSQETLPFSNTSWPLISDKDNETWQQPEIFTNPFSSSGDKISNATEGINNGNSSSNSNTSMGLDENNSSTLWVHRRYSNPHPPVGTHAHDRHVSLRGDFAGVRIGRGRLLRQQQHLHNLASSPTLDHRGAAAIHLGNSADTFGQRRDSAERHGKWHRRDSSSDTSSTSSISDDDAQHGSVRIYLDVPEDARQPLSDLPSAHASVSSLGPLLPEQQGSDSGAANVTRWNDDAEPRVMFFVPEWASRSGGDRTVDDTMQGNGRV